jgi:nitrogen fixation NifU-like protein
MYLTLEDDQVKDISWEGSGCAISRASASLLTSTLKGKSKAEVSALFEKVHELVTTGKGNDPELGKLAVFAGVYKFPARVKCAILPWHAAVAAMNEPGATVSTESEEQ